jgi:outer membrane protein assembly factor BamB
MKRNLIYSAIIAMALISGCKLLKTQKQIGEKAPTQTPTETWQVDLIDYRSVEPTVSNSIVYIPDGRKIKAIDTKTQTVKWEKSPGRGEPIKKPCVVYNNTVLLFYERMLIAFDTETGEKKWTDDNQHSIFQPYFRTANGLLYFSNVKDELCAVDVNNGHLKWKIKSAGVYTEPIVTDSILVYTHSREEWIDQNNKKKVSDLCAVNAFTGDEIWRKSFRDFSDMKWRYGAISDNKLVITGKDNTLFCYDVKTGNDLWQFKMDEGRNTMPPIIKNGIIYTGKKSLHVIELGTGRQKWKYDIPRAIIIASNAILVQRLPNSIVALNPETGVEIWTYTQEKNFTMANELTNNQIIIGSANKKLSALK